MGQCVIVIDLFSMKLYTCEQEQMRTIIIKKKFLLFKHEKMNQTLSNDWPTYCHTGINVSLSNSIFFICKSNNILYQVTSFTFHSHSETLHFFHYYQIKKLIKQFFFLDFGISGFFDNWFPLISYNVLPWISGFL